MKEFFKFLFASTLGTLLALGLLFIIGLIMINAMVAAASKTEPIQANSVLHLKFENVIPEQTNNIEINVLDFKQAATIGLHDYIDLIQRAKEDDAIKGIYLEPSQISVGFTTLSQIREALLDFKSSGKFILAYSSDYSQGGYYLASVADSVYVHPLGGVDFRGFASTVPFFKTMLDKIGVEMQVFYAGKYKGATESYRLTELSEPNRQQIREYVDSIYADFLQDISASRQVSVDSLRFIANEYLGWNAEGSKSSGLVDVIGYSDEVVAAIRQHLGLKENAKLGLVSAGKYWESRTKKTDYSIKDKVAIVYAEGTIIEGEGANGMIGDEQYRQILTKIRKDDNIKAVVLRVNSPGGSAMASESIWRELELLEEAKKPLVISMGDYAASGGYYLASAGDTILAEENTLTGSIGVFSTIPNAQKLLNDKLGITFDTVKTGQFSTGISPFFQLSPAEQRLLQRHTDQMYQTFLKRVADNRNMTIEQVNEIAQGRVWTGEAAVKVGLVDKIGGLEEAIQIAAHMAKLENYRVTEYPTVKEPLKQLVEEIFSQEQAKTNRIKAELGIYYPYYEQLKTLKDMQGVQARLPFMLDIW